MIQRTWSGRQERSKEATRQGGAPRGPTRLIFLAMGEVLSFGFNLSVLDPSDRKGNDTYCIVAIEDKKMGFISYCLSLSLYIMSSYLMRYSVLMNLIL